MVREFINGTLVRTSQFALLTKDIEAQELQ